MEEHRLRHLSCKEGAEAILRGEIIAYPTEGVYGLGVDVSNREAVASLYRLKQRDHRKGFIVIADRLARLDAWLKPLKDEERRAILSVGAHGYRHTWLVEVNDHAPRWVMGDSDLLAIRISNHPVVVELCQKLKMPLVSTSANISNEPTLLTYDALSDKFYGKITGLVRGELGHMNGPSKIIQLNQRIVIRE